MQGRQSLASSNQRTFQRILDCFNSTEAESLFNPWYSSAIRCRLASVKDLARMLKAHLENLLTYFTYSISNALTEGFNSKIKSLKRLLAAFVLSLCVSPPASSLALLNLARIV